MPHTRHTRLLPVTYGTRRVSAYRTCAQPDERDRPINKTQNTDTDVRKTIHRLLLWPRAWFFYFSGHQPTPTGTASYTVHNPRDRPHRSRAPQRRNQPKPNMMLVAVIVIQILRASRRLPRAWPLLDFLVCVFFSRLAWVRGGRRPSPEPRGGSTVS